MNNLSDSPNHFIRPSKPSLQLSKSYTSYFKLSVRHLESNENCAILYYAIQIQYKRHRKLQRKFKRTTDNQLRATLSVMILISFQPGVTFQYPLKTSENL